jgi:hypothetical protein
MKYIYIFIKLNKERVREREQCASWRNIWHSTYTGLYSYTPGSWELIIGCSTSDKLYV